MSGVGGAGAIVCTAEAFGFGPAAALRQILPYLRRAGRPLHYAGYGLTLDLHTTRDYAEVTPCNPYTEEGAELLRGQLSPGSLFVSVCDVGAADIAKKCGARVALYDPLAWFREPLPPACWEVDRYLCPDFFGVAERIAALELRNARRVAPLMPSGPLERQAPVEVLVNLGGLKTPYSEHAQCVRYAQLIVDQVGKSAGCAPVVLVSAKIGHDLRRCAVRTATPTEARGLVGGARAVFATPGLGNIFDAAGLGAPACFLPPVSDSQGQQLVMLRQRGLLPAAIDWHDVTGQAPIDYWSGKPTIMAGIAAAIAEVAGSAAAQARLADHLHAAMHPPAPPRRDWGAGLRERFGSDDGSLAAREICALLPAATS